MFKVCFKCNESKPICEFYKHPRMADGHLNKCKTCAKRDVNKHREENIESFREYDRERGKTRKRIDRNIERQRVARKEMPWKHKAYDLVRRALASGKLTKMPCLVCGSTVVEGHHEDYMKPLEVVWLCKIHHEDVHREKGEFKVNSNEKLLPNLEKGGTS